MKYLIIGRSGSGKDTLAHELEAKGLTTLKTYATRLPHTVDDEKHHYITGKEADALPDRFAEIEIQNGRYFITSNLFETTNPDVIVIEPSGAKELVERYPSICFQIIYLRAKNDDLRKHHAIEHACDKNKETKIFEERIKSEDCLFADFEINVNKGSNGKAFAPNAVTVHSIRNDYQIETLHAMATKLVRNRTLFNNIYKIVGQGLNLGLLYSEKKGTVNMYSTELAPGGDANLRVVSQDYFVDMMMSDPESFNLLLTEWLSCPLELDATLDGIIHDDEEKPITATVA